MTTPLLTSRFDQALVYASDAHREQLRKGGDIPYVSHLLGVTALALEHGANEDEAIAALLHDAVEDAGGQPRLEDIRAKFGPVVAEIVWGCTDADVTPKPPWQARKEQYIARLAGGSRSVMLVSCADKVHNSRSIVGDLREEGARIWSRFTKGKDGTLWYYRSLIAAYQNRGDEGPPRRLLDELIRVYAEMEELAGAK